jgi:hypothetical protein
MVRTLLGEWAYARPNWSLAGQPPISRTPVNNPTGKNS